MAEMALNLDLMAGLWPLIPAPVPSSDDDLEIDLAFEAILQSQPVQPVQPVVTGQATVDVLPVQGSRVQGPGFEVVQGSKIHGPRVQGPLVQGSETERPDVEVAATSVPQPEVSAPSAVPAQVLLPEPLQQPLPAPQASVQSSELPSFSPAETVGLKPDGSEDLVVPAAKPSIPSPAVTERGVPEPARSTTISELPDFRPAETIGLKADGSEIPVPDRFGVAVSKAVSRPPRQRERDDPADAPVSVMLAPHVGARSSAPSTPIEAPVTPAPGPPAAMTSAPVATVPQAPVVHDSPAPAALPQTLVPTTDDGAPVMPRLVEMMRWQAREGGGQAELRLRPEFLGAVTVSIVVENGAVKATVTAEAPAALEYLRSESSGLQEALEERGLTLDEFEVREESPLTDRRRDDEQRKERQESAQAPRRRVIHDANAVFSVLV